MSRSSQFTVGDGVPIEEWANEFIYVAYLISTKRGGIAKASLNRRT